MSHDIAKDILSPESLAKVELAIDTDGTLKVRDCCSIISTMKGHDTAVLDGIFTADQRFVIATWMRVHKNG